jgi:arabinogalactan endo-1,4-beta-galactosidase
MRRILCLAGLVGVAVVLVWVPSAAAGSVQCTGTLTGPIQGNVVVPSGGSCVLLFAAVSGDVSAQAGSSLAINNVTIGGNLTCNGCSSIALLGSTTAGTVLISHATTGINIDNARIEGDVAVTSSRNSGSCCFNVSRNTIGGNLSFNNNEGLSQIVFNAIGGNLSCQNNVPAPVTLAASPAVAVVCVIEVPRSVRCVSSEQREQRTTPAATVGPSGRAGRAPRRAQQRFLSRPKTSL